MLCQKAKIDYLLSISKIWKNENLNISKRSYWYLNEVRFKYEYEYGVVQTFRVIILSIVLIKGENGITRLEPNPCT